MVELSLFSSVSNDSCAPDFPRLWLLDAHGLQRAVRERGQDRLVSERENGIKHMGLRPASLS